jgi:small subunit ribosomal protein S4
MTKRISKYKLLRYYKQDLFGTLRLLEIYVRKITPNDAIFYSLVSKYLKKKENGLLSSKSKFSLKQRLTRWIRTFKELKFNKQIIKKRIEYRKGKFRRRRREKFHYRVDIGEPGRKRRKMTLFSKRLFNRHKIRFSCSLMSLSTFRSYIKSSLRFNKLFLSFNRYLETRLDFFIKRINLPFFSIQSIRQFINHGNVLVNGKVCNIQSFHLKLFDIVSLIDKETIYSLLCYLIRRRKIDFHLSNIPKYIEINFRIYSAVLLYYPKTSEIPMFPFINNNRAVISGKRFKG